MREKGKKIISVLLAVICVISFSTVSGHAEENTYNYLALGDSLTVHDPDNNWFQRCGMAASVPEKDYVHLVSAYLQQQYGNVYSETFNGNWGMTASLLEKYYSDLSELLKQRTYNLITIQYGANLRTDVGAESEFIRLLDLCKQYSPQARIILVGNFWEKTDYMHNIDAIKLSLAQKYGYGFANLTPIKDDTHYQRGIGGIVYDAQGQPHTVTTHGVAIHPNDEGMAYIAARIEEQISPQAAIDTNITKATPALSVTQIDLYLGEKRRLTFSNANGSVKWTASNDNVSLSQQSDSGVKVTGVQAGSSVVKVTVNGVSAKCYVFVSEKPLADGWHKLNKLKYYYQDNRPLKGVQLIGKKFYVFDKKGVYQDKLTKKLRKAVKKNTAADDVKKAFKANGAEIWRTVKKKKSQIWYYDGFELRFNVQEEKSKKGQKKTVITLKKYALTKHKDGIYKVGKTQYYYVNNKKLIGIHIIKNKFYVFDDNGKYRKWRTEQLRKASVVNADAYKLKRLLKKYGATYKYTTDLGYSCFGDGTDRVIYYVGFQVSALKHTTGELTVESLASAS